MNPRPRRIAVGLMIAGDAVGITGGGAVTAGSPSQFTKPGKAQARQALVQVGQLPLRFETNRGQFDAGVRFAARGLDYGLALTPTGCRADASRRGRRVADRVTPDRVTTVRMSLVGANADPVISGTDPLPGLVHHFHGNDPAAWRTNVQLFARVRYDEVYDGIAVVYYGSDQQRLEYDFELAPGRDPKTIRLRFEGITGLSIDESTGDLLLHVKDGEPVRQHAPVSYQQIAGERRPVDSRYVIHADRTVGFAVGAYDRTAPLTIDPVLRYSTVFGGASEETINDIVLDSGGNIYVTGFSWDNLGFPTTPGVDQTREGPSDAIRLEVQPVGIGADLLDVRRRRPRREHRALRGESRSYRGRRRGQRLRRRRDELDQLPRHRGRPGFDVCRGQPVASVRRLLREARSDGAAPLRHLHRRQRLRVHHGHRGRYGRQRLRQRRLEFIVGELPADGRTRTTAKHAGRRSS